MQYDEQFLLRAAENLEQKARDIVISTAARYALAAFVICSGVATLLVKFGNHDDVMTPAIVMVAIVTVLAALVGVLKGRELAFELRVQVHQLLVLVEIERRLPAHEFQT